MNPSTPGPFKPAWWNLKTNHTKVCFAFKSEVERNSFFKPFHQPPQRTCRTDFIATFNPFGYSVLMLTLKRIAFAGFSVSLPGSFEPTCGLPLRLNLFRFSTSILMIWTINFCKFHYPFHLIRWDPLNLPAEFISISYPCGFSILMLTLKKNCFCKFSYFIAWSFQTILPTSSTQSILSDFSFWFWCSDEPVFANLLIISSSPLGFIRLPLNCHTLTNVILLILALKN